MSLGIGCRAAEQQLYNANPHVAQENINDVAAALQT